MIGQAQPTLILTFTFSRVWARSATFGEHRTEVADPMEKLAREGGQMDPRFDLTAIGVDEVGDLARKPAGVDGLRRTLR
ncbi:hypothetical protein JTB14_032336 [Gonioctena quinquepunctata]|nr:hypothetical protein JTB14_032336 [Gonioctena quinquepunctata]